MHGAGQNAALVRLGLTFRPDWEGVITPVVPNGRIALTAGTDRFEEPAAPHRRRPRADRESVQFMP